MPPKTLAIETRAGGRDGLRIVTLRGHLTLELVFRFEQAIRDDKTSSTIVDLTEVEHVDSAGLGSIVMAQVSHQRSERRFALVGVQERVTKLLAIAGLSPVLTIFDTVESAEKALA